MNRLRRVPAAFAAAFLISYIAATGGQKHEPNAGPAIRVLILSGQNNHDWKATTPKLKAILEKTGGFKVDVSETPGLLTASSLESNDVILSNWNSFGLGPDAERWPEETKQAYLDFVRRGKGHVVVHAGSASFPDWKEYGRLTLATYKAGQTRHGPRHKFPVRIDKADHPVTAGLEPFEIDDELWNRPGLTKGVTVLASSYSSPDKEGTGQWEPTALVGRFDRGRCFTLLLGHDVEAMENPGFQALLRRGVEWAATGRVAEKAKPASQSWGGYSGLSVRFAKDIAERQVTTSDGPVIEFSDSRYRGKHTALDYSGLFEGRPAGIAVCDHPDNPRSPTPWYAIRSDEMSFFTPAVICYEPITLEPGRSVALRYRVFIHPGPWDAGRLRAEYERFSGKPALATRRP